MIIYKNDNLTIEVQENGLVKLHHQRKPSFKEAQDHDKATQSTDHVTVYFSPAVPAEVSQHVETHEKL